MATFVIYDVTSGQLLGKCQLSDAGDLAAAMAAHTTATQGTLAVDESVTPIANTSMFLVMNGALVAQESLAVVQTVQSAVIEQAYQNVIQDGFPSSGLGALYVYPSTPVDQFNLTASIVASLIPGQPANWTTLFWCGDASTPPVWNYVAHTAAQIHQVGLDSMAYIMAAKQRRAVRLGQIKAATTAAQVQAIVW